jgi:hypothetical protein
MIPISARGKRPPETSDNGDQTDDYTKQFANVRLQSGARYPTQRSVLRPLAIANKLQFSS